MLGGQEKRKDRKTRKSRSEWRGFVRGISLLSLVGKICDGILVDRVRRVTGGLIDFEQRGFRTGRWCT